MIANRMLVFGVVLAALCGSRTAEATGMIGHIYVSEKALEQLPAGELKSLLEPRTAYWENGSFLPDSGYAAEDAYGEMAHWAQFVEAYIQWIQAHYEPPYTSGEAANHVAVLMGAASHSMVDQVFDILFWDKVAVMDGSAEDLDTGIDAWIVGDLDRRAADQVVIDPAALADIFSTYFDYEVSPDTIAGGMETAIQGQQVVELVLAPGDLFREDMPWAYAHYLDPKVPGSYPWGAEVIWRYWQNLWRRLGGDHGLDEAIIGTHPREGERIAVGHDSLDSYVTFFVGHGMTPESITEQSAWIENADEQVVPTALRVRGDDWIGTIQLRPLQDWDYETTYTMVLDGLQSLYGEQLDEPYRLEFATECAPGNEAACAEPTPVAPAAVDDEGCGFTAPPARGGSPGLWLLAIVVLAARRGRRMAGELARAGERRRSGFRWSRRVGRTSLSHSRCRCRASSRNVCG